MSNSIFGMSFAHGQVPSTPPPGEEPVMLPTTTCTITDAEGETIAEATVVPFHTTVDNRVYARRFAFQKAVNTKIPVTNNEGEPLLYEVSGEPILTHLISRENRRILWQLYRNAYRQADKKNPPVRIRTIEALLKKFPGVSPDDYAMLAAQVRAVLLGAKKLKTMDSVSPEEMVKAPVPNSEPMEAVA